MSLILKNALQVAPPPSTNQQGYCTFMPLLLSKLRLQYPKGL